MKPDAGSSATIVAKSAGNLSIRGAVSPDSAEALRNEGERLIRASSAGTADGAALVISLAGLDAASSVTLSLLLSWQRCARSEHKTLAFSDVGERLRSLAALSDLQHHLPGF